MRILHVIPSVSKVHGGPSQAIAMMERALSERGVSVSTLTTDDDGPGRRLASFAETGAESEVCRIYLRKRSEFYKFAPSIFAWLHSHLEEYEVVHIHALFSFTSIAAALMARLAGVPYIIRPLGTLTRYGVERRRPWLKRLSLTLIEGPLLRGASAVHFTSVAEAAEAAQLGIDLNSVVIPLGIIPDPLGDAGRLTELPSQPQRRPILLYLSRLDPKKNVEGLLQACALLRQRDQSFLLLIGGSGDPAYVGKLKTLAASMSLDDEIIWLGQVAGDRKAGALAAADVFVLPSFSENFGIAVVEALFAGLPCVIGKGVAIAEDVAVAGAGIAVEPTPDAIADGISQLLASQEIRDDMAGRARSLAAREYSATTMGARLEALYRDITRNESADSP